VLIIKKLASSEILQELMRRIEEEDWVVGQKLPSISTLAKEFTIGVSTLREAIRILENRGYVLIEHGRGMFVRSRNYWQGDNFLEMNKLSSGDLSALVEFRGVLEPVMAQLAAERGSPGQIRCMKESAAVMIDNLAQGEDYFQADIAFHDHIAQACSNDVMAKVMKGISDLLLESRRTTSRVPGSAERAAHFHMLIALAIEQHDGKLAKEMMSAHLEDVHKDFLKLKADS
jgi:GntR family transcriptional repressor for pyruvate dehydrogenase complex